MSHDQPLIFSPPLLVAQSRHEEPMSPSINRSVDQSNNQSFEPSINQSIYRNVAHLSADDLSIPPSYHSTDNQTNNHTIKQSINHAFSSSTPHIPMIELDSHPISQSNNLEFPTPKKAHLSLPQSSSNQSISQINNQTPRKLSSQSNPSNNQYKFLGFKANKHPISLQFSDICLTLPNGQPILSGVTGHFAHSRVHAIMGPSGAGKTSFLNVLAGRCSSGDVTGQLKINHINQSINGKINQSTNQSIKSISGYVPQDDILHSDLTVYENLYYSAMLRLPQSMPHARKLQIIEDVLTMLGIQRVRDQLVGSVEKRGISGGQRKRVNIGCELVANVSILFMDEPTSGLDASAALEVLSALESLSQNGLTVITVVHQPRYAIFAQFHSVLLLGTGGRTVFLGPTDSALPYFASLGLDLPPHENPADFFLDCISGVHRTRRIVVDDDHNEQSNNHSNDGLKHRSNNPSINQDGKKTIVVTLPPLVRTQSNPSIPFVDLIPSTSLQRTLSSSQTITNILIDINQSINQTINPDNSTSDLQEPIIDFAQAWIDHQTKVEQDKRVRRQSMNQANYPSFEDQSKYLSINPPTNQSSPESRLRSLSNCSDLSDGARSLINQSINQSINDSGEPNKPIDRSISARLKSVWSSSERKRKKMAAYEQMFSEFAEHLIDDEHPDSSDNHSINQSNNHSTNQYDECKESNIAIHVPLNDNESFWPQMLCQKEEYDSDDEEWLESYNQSNNQTNNHSVNHSNKPSSKHVFGLPKLKAKPSLLTQYLLLTKRLTKKLLRNKGHILVDIFLVVFLSVTVGIVYGSGWSLGEYTTQSVFSSLCMGVCATVASLRIFGADRLVYWRESLVGISETAYFFALLTCELHRTFLYPAIFVACYLPLAQPQASFLGIWGVFCGVYFSMSGLGLLISTLIKPVPALMIGTMTPLVIGGFLSGVNPPVKQMSPFMGFVSGFSFTRWAVEGVAMLEAEHVDVYGADNIFWWNQHFGFVKRYGTDVGLLVVMGLVFRLLTGLALRRFSRSQKV